MFLTPKRIRLDCSTTSRIKEQTETFDLLFFFLLFDYSKPRYKLFFPVVRKLISKIVGLFFRPFVSDVPTLSNRTESELE